jgi:hypothetical protein
MFFHLDDEEGNNNLISGERGMHVNFFEANIFVIIGMTCEIKSKSIQDLTKIPTLIDIRKKILNVYA